MIEIYVVTQVINNVTGVVEWCEYTSYGRPDIAYPIVDSKMTPESTYVELTTNSKEEYTALVSSLKQSGWNEFDAHRLHKDK